jgi:succinate dehydrogenase cytochrome b subunit
MIFPMFSSVAKKIFLAVTGLCLAGFISVHLAGNFLLLVGPGPFNLYAHKLVSLGVLLYVAEIILLSIFALHLSLAVYTQIVNWRARPQAYKKTRHQGETSRLTISSRSMIWTGLVIIIFTVIHVITFKYGPGLEEGYYTSLDGEKIRDLYRLVAESFQKEYYVIPYLAVMTVLGLHLKHALWSAIHTLGGTNPRVLPALYVLSTLAAIALGTGFFLLPLWFYFSGGTL